jgi:hypothetical protein
VLGHLLHGEKNDWMKRLEIILKDGPSRIFDPFDGQAQFREIQGKSLSMLLGQIFHIAPRQRRAFAGLEPAAGAI